MHKFVVKQPIKTSDNKLIGYELLFNVENELYNQNSNDYNAADTISTFLTLNNDKIDRSTRNFMTFTPNLLFKNMPKMFKVDELVIQIEDNVIVHPLAQKIVQRYKEAGYQIAINDFQFAPRYFAFMDYTDFIKINVKDTPHSAVDNILRTAKGFGKKCIATNIDSKELYNFAKQFDFDLFEGHYVAEAAIIKANKIQYMQSNFFQLVVAITKDEPDVDEIDQIIERDASLTYELLRIVNSVHFALRHRTDSVKQAIVVLGIEQLKRWVYLLSFDKDLETGTEDLLRISFLRATFSSELVHYCKEMPITKSEAYLMGMLSALELMVDAPMSEIMDALPVTDIIKNALVKHEGRCGILYDLVLSYERAEWDNINKYAEELGIPANCLAQVYFDCVENVNEIWKGLSESKFKDEENAEKAIDKL
ncbi:MAG: HDOD domain-containing protein [Clostridiales bacterium]|nr:HDOD domain-containing protein [Clostridiales bacterium]